jgi:cytochrome c oxidase subunit I
VGGVASGSFKIGKEMSKYLLRVENILLIFPLLLFVFSGNIFNSDSALDIHLHDTYFVISYASLFYPCFVLLLLPYLLHGVLRLMNKWGSRFCYFHIFATAGVLLLIIASFYYSLHSGIAATPRRYFDMSGWESFLFYAGTQKAVVVPIITFLSLQLLFFFYMLVQPIRKK